MKIAWRTMKKVNIAFVVQGFIQLYEHNLRLDICSSNLIIYNYPDVTWTDICIQPSIWNISGRYIYIAIRVKNPYWIYKLSRWNIYFHSQTAL